ncbi:MAG: DNA mismatch repair protein MutS [Acidobacteria bacterium]|nr:DNA mismatch repair protein MutS [Acidobacteriota bacterium]
MSTVTPAMRQYFDAKRQHRDAIVFFRMGDFYEMFYEDALVAARALELTLTSRSKDANGTAIPMCGLPYHAADGYITRLVRQGFRVAICEQVEDPKKAKGVVKREVVRVVSPGTLTDAGYLDAREPAFIAAIAPSVSGGKTETLGVALLDLSTGEFAAAEYEGAGCFEAAGRELALLRPREIVAADGVDLGPITPNGSGPRLTRIEGWSFEASGARKVLLEQFRTHSLAAFGLEDKPAAVSAAGALVQHLRDTQKADLAHVRAISLRGASDCLVLDASTLKHMEIAEGAEGGRAGSLVGEIDRSVTPMGSRMLRGWLLRPLIALPRIQDRLDAVEDFAFRGSERARLRDALKSIHDLERLTARAALGTAGPRDLVALQQSLSAIPRVKTVVADLQAPLVTSLVAEIDDLTDVRDAIESTLIEDPGAFARDGGYVRDGLDAEIDGLRTISRGGKQLIADMEEAERARTGINSLKIRYNRVFGYYIEISKSNLGAVPPDYHRKQTIAGGERFITPALKDYEEKVVGADERILAREIELFEALRARVAGDSGRLQDTARALGTLDALAAFAETAAVCNYIKPLMHDGDELQVVDGRHPVVERLAPGSDAAFVPNDINLDGGAQQLVILTGPNMGGKSTYLRQTALISVLAQAGSFVPAKRAKLPIIDRVFARVGASDNIARGHSTFMVEMQETANILHAATHRSLVILDEIGRGTSTFDGLSLAWAVAEHLATNDHARPKTIFATHYHELTDLADAIPGVVNYHVVVREYKDDIVFLRKVVPGRSDRSYGIQVARLAGLPAAVVDRAREILQNLEQDELSRGGRPSLSEAGKSQRQLGLFQQSIDQAPAEVHRVVKALRETNLDQLTPLDALNLLARFKKDAES